MKKYIYSFHAGCPLKFYAEKISFIVNYVSDAKI